MVTSVKRIFEARDLMLADGQLPDHLSRALNPTVLQSWKRSVLSGFDPGAPSLQYHGDAQGHASLRVAADPVLTELAERLSGLDVGVCLSDQDSVIVRRWVASRSPIRRLLDQINSDVGFSANEQIVGTNGAGSAIEFGAPMQISGPEHLAPALAPFTCVGVPIHHPISRRLEGCVAVSCRASSGNPLLIPLMTSTARDIERRMLDAATATERALLDAYTTAIGTRRAPIAAIGPDILIAGPQVTELLDGTDRALLWEYVREAAGRGRDVDDRYPSGRFRISRCRLVEHDDRVIGALIEFDVRPESDKSALDVAGRPTLTLPGASAAQAQTVSHAIRLAATRVSILIEGETGVGKTALARAILEAAKVDPDRTVTVDCSTVGLDGGSTFIAMLRQHVERRPQAIVLRHLESLSAESASAAASFLERAAESDSAPRIIATLTTSSQEGPPPNSLRRLVDTVAFGRVNIMPLRNRREDIASAAVALLKKHGGEHPYFFSSAALRCLIRAPWPGNLRQLDAVVRAVVSTTIGTEIRPDDLPAELQAQSRRDLSTIEELELSAILDSLRRHGGNKVAAAQSIGISRSTLYRKLQSYRIDPDKQYY